jgi:hypothetical protein
LSTTGDGDGGIGAGGPDATDATSGVADGAGATADGPDGPDAATRGADAEGVGPGQFCGMCGADRADGDHSGCEAAAAYDTPRYCTTCGFRLDVQILPSAVRAWCRRCRPRQPR